MKPSIGRIVHYQSYGTPDGEYLPEPRAAIITEVDELRATEESEAYTAVGLAILNPTGMFFSRLVKYSEHPKPGHWSWPPRDDMATTVKSHEC